MKFLLSALLSLCFIAAKAQIIEDPTQVLQKIQGDPVFSLNAGEKVYSYEPESDWFKIRKEVYIDPSSIVDEKYIASGTSLYNKEQEEIGKTLKDVKIVEGEKEKSFHGKERYHAIIEGYVFKTKFTDNSRPEDRISQLLALRNRTQQVEGFKELYDEYGFEKRDFEDLTAYVYREQNKTIKPEKDFREILLFRGESPYAVITNDQTVKAEKIKASWEDGDYKIIYFYKPTAAQEDLVQNTILYTFLAL